MLDVGRFDEDMMYVEMSIYSRIDVYVYNQ